MRFTFSKITISAIALIVFFFSAPQTADAQILNEILSTMDEQRNNLQYLKADIVKTEFEATLGDEDKREGRVQYLPKENKDAFFRIDWEEPDEVLIVAAGKYLLWRKRFNTVISGKVDSAVKEKGTNNALKFMGMSKAELKKNYKVAYLGRPSLSGTKVWHLKLTPKSGNGFKEAFLWVDRYGMPIQAELVQINKDATTIRLSDIRTDEPIEPAVFRPDLKGVTRLKA